MKKKLTRRQRKQLALIITKSKHISPTKWHMYSGLHHHMYIGKYTVMVSKPIFAKDIKVNSAFHNLKVV